jgi:hypothetical protein
MPIRTAKYLWLACISLLLFNACKAPRRVSTVESPTLKTSKSFFEGVERQALTFHTLTARTRFSIWWGGNNEMSSRVDLKMVKDSAFQFSIQPLFGLEVARIEFGRDTLKAMDRMNRQYLVAAYDDLKQDVPLAFNFYNLQALFTNRIFEPGRRALTAARYGRFHLAQRDGAMEAYIRDALRLLYVFRADGDEKLLNTSISLPNAGFRLKWAYSDFQRTEGGTPFPMQMDVSLNNQAKAIAGAGITFSRLQTDIPLRMDFPIPANYKRVGLADLLKLLKPKV